MVPQPSHCAKSRGFWRNATIDRLAGNYATDRRLVKQLSQILPLIRSPEQISSLTRSELRQLTRELREKVVRVVASNGGHLASNLGVVELTLALHLAFDFATDRLIWDVGHQTYIHKLLTGRVAEFGSLRQFKGISGFPKPEESPYDHFIAGHSSTSISAALGMAKARDLQGQQHHVVAVIGDGALTGGMAWEALNHTGDSGTRLIVVLNDNEMSIARNVGAMSSYLAKARTAPRYLQTKADVEEVLRRIPLVGERLLETSGRLKESLKHLLVPGMIFEELGFTYLGPVDGHDIAALTSMFEYAKSLDEPVLVHCITTKGKGYRPAEQEPQRFHGTGPFNPATGKSWRSAASAVRSYTEVFADTLCDLASREEKIVAITAAMPDGTGLTRFRERYPERFFDVGIAEQHAVTFAAGLASQGFRPVFAVYSTFLQRAYDQLLHDVCLPALPVVMAIDRAGLVGADGETHQGVFDLAMLRQMPNMTVLAPRDAQELVNGLHFALKQRGPVAIRYPRGAAPSGNLVPAQPLEAGRAVCLQQGKDILLVNCGTIWDLTRKVADQLSLAGFTPTIYDVRFVKPLDESLGQLAREHAVTAVLEEGVIAGGCGSALLEMMAAQNLSGNVLLFGIPDRFVPHGQRSELLQALGLNPEAITRSILDRLARRM